jgi:predicted CoA-binding protein
VATRALIEEILRQRRFAVTGVSRNPEKYGRIVYRALKEAGYTVFAVNPNLEEVDGDLGYPSLDNIPGPIDCVVTVTPPEITEQTMRVAGHLQVPYIWMQPGSESIPAFQIARGAGCQIVADGTCILVMLAQYRDQLIPAG